MYSLFLLAFVCVHVLWLFYSIETCCYCVVEYQPVGVTHHGSLILLVTLFTLGMLFVWTSCHLSTVLKDPSVHGLKMTGINLSEECCVFWHSPQGLKSHCHAGPTVPAAIATIIVGSSNVILAINWGNDSQDGLTLRHFMKLDRPVLTTPSPRFTY